MTREEIIKKIEVIEANRFYLAMKDRWSRADFDTDHKWWNELMDLKEKLAKVS